MSAFWNRLELSWAASCLYNVFKDVKTQETTVHILYLISKLVGKVQQHHEGECFHSKISFCGDDLQKYFGI